MTTAIESRVLAAVDARRDDLIAFLRRIVRIPSVTGHEGEVQAAIAETMAALGLEVDQWEPTAEELAPYALHVGAFETLAGRPNVVGSLRGKGGGRSLILNAHVDVVDAGDPARWTHPPFGAEIRDGRLYGRGACDMKAGLAANLFALQAVRDAGIEPRGDVFVESVISEEDGGAGTLAAILRGYTADAAIITEPTRLALIHAQGGSLVFRLRVTGRSAHGAVRDEGVSAVEKFAYLHRALLDFEARHNAAIDHPAYAAIANKVPISIGVVHAGNWPSSVPETLIAEGRAGLVPGEDLAAFGAELAQVVAEAAATDPWLRSHLPTVEACSGQFAPAEVPVDSPIARLVADAHRAATGSEIAVDAATYGADMRHFVNTAGIPCVMYGAGDVRVAHYTDELVPLDEVMTVARTLALAIVDWCG
jgi:acetylornithine deacetylase